MSLIFRRHAARRLVERYLSEHDVMLTIAFPDSLEEQKRGIMVSRKTLGLKHVTVVWHRDERGNHVVHTVI